MFKAWRYLYSLGTDQLFLSENAKRQTIIGNKISLIIIILCLLVLPFSIFVFKDTDAIVRALLVVLIASAALVANRYHLYKLSKWVLVFAPAMIILILPILTGDIMDGNFLTYPCICIGISMMPYLVFDQSKEKVALIAGVVLYFLFTLFIDRLLMLGGNHNQFSVWIMENYLAYKIPYLTIWIFVNFAVYNLIRTNKRYIDELYTLNEEIKEKILSIALQNETLKKQRDHISQINQNLEKIVEERTEKLQSQNQRLIEYSFLNAHKIRGPLARIMGLVYLTKSQVSEDEKLFILDKIDYSAKELDDVVKEINQTLHDVEQSKK
ncbi:MAG: hypothetical protein AAFX87_04250 [Bacteroidota bacterium]